MMAWFEEEVKLAVVATHLSTVFVSENEEIRWVLIVEGHLPAWDSDFIEFPKKSPTISSEKKLLSF
jgi:hypothetical protein